MRIAAAWLVVCAASTEARARSDERHAAPSSDTVPPTRDPGLDTPPVAPAETPPAPLDGPTVPRDLTGLETNAPHEPATETVPTAEAPSPESPDAAPPDPATAKSPEAAPTNATSQPAAPSTARSPAHDVTPFVAEADAERERPRTQRARARTPKLAAYLTREVPSSVRFLDHGVIEASVAGGYPHRYRLGVAMGLLDHITLGLTVHWLPGQSRPRIAPRIAVAAYRWRWIEVGAAYDRSLYPPPKVDDDPKTWSFQRDAHWITAVAAFSQSWISAGFEVGVVRGRVPDPGRDPTEDNLNPAVWRNRLGGGVMVRMGTRRWGFSFTGRAPWAYAEAAFDVRFGAFELRRRGGWRPQGIVRATDRRIPRRR